MESSSLPFRLLCAFFFLFFCLRRVLSDSGSVGINYGRIADNLPSPPQAVQLLKAQGITKIKIFDTDGTVLSALSGSGISVVVALPNEQLQSAAGDQTFTDSWVQSNILPYHPNCTIDAIAVGNEVFVDPRNTTVFLVPAMKNVHASLVKYGVGSAIKVSSPFALTALQTSYPSSSGTFKQDLVEPVIKPILNFLRRTDSYLMLNAYPYFAYTANTDTIPLEYALSGDKAAGVVDPNNGLVYKSLFDAQIDAVFAAMDDLGFNDVKVVVSETGWPSKGDDKEIGASTANAAAYNGNLVRRVLIGGGTPRRPEATLNVYLFALFNENQKTGPTSEKNYGLFYPNEEKVYDIALTVQGVRQNNKTQSQNKAPAPIAGGEKGGVPRSNVQGETWCVANGNAGEKKLREALVYACEAGADCRPLQQPDPACQIPDTTEAHASYAFNSYYQRNARRSGTCNFGGAAYVVSQPPKYGSCEFPTGN